MIRTLSLFRYLKVFLKDIDVMVVIIRDI